MVDLAALRQQIRQMEEPTSKATVSRRWLEEVERDLSEYRLLQTREQFRPRQPMQGAR